ncbi:Uncharacterised protein [Rothia kristinae]|nr:Uncharacterised protein [Rothia kristinae]
MAPVVVHEQHRDRPSTPTTTTYQGKTPANPCSFRNSATYSADPPNRELPIAYVKPTPSPRTCAGNISAFTIPEIEVYRLRNSIATSTSSEAVTREEARPMSVSSGTTSTIIPST